MCVEKLTDIGEIQSASGGGQHRGKFVNFIVETKGDESHVGISPAVRIRRDSRICDIVAGSARRTAGGNWEMVLAVSR